MQSAPADRPRRSPNARLRLGATAAALTFALVGCGGSDDTGADPTATASVPPASTTTSLAAPEPETTPAASAAPTTPPPTTASPTTTPPTTAATTATTATDDGIVVVRIIDFAFDPPTLDVPVGTTVRWVNDDTFDHSVVADDGTFSSEALAPGDNFEFTFDAAGTFSYICGIHPSMLGTITVA